MAYSFGGAAARLWAEFRTARTLLVAAAPARGLTACLDRFQGLHILMLSSPAIDEAAVRLTAAGVRHGGVNTVRRAAPSGAGSPVETIRYLEIEGQEPHTGTAPGPGTVPEGRVGIVADLDPGIQSARHLDHPNGATGLAEATLCVADEDLAATHHRYATYLDRSPRQEGRALVFDLDGAALRLIPSSALPTTLPGEEPPALPALVAYTVTVRDLPPVPRCPAALRTAGPGPRTGPATSAYPGCQQG
ncbi:VOC family protein [Streptomyces rubiginosohelvolus]|uniref:VOC family protein n=1 Tax=Streptomyces rubiginosohelvolus TaxID=67362 RepID=UPI0033AD2E3E